MLSTGSFFLDLFGVFAALTAVAIAWMQYRFTYWAKKGLVSPPTHWFYGNAQGLLTRKKTLTEFSTDQYNYISKTMKQPHGGFYLMFTPVYMPTDPEFIKNVMQNDFAHFVNRGLYYNEKDDPLSAHMFTLEDAKWRNLRVKVTPTFTSGKMKMMFETVVKVSDQLTAEMDKNAGRSSVEMKDILARYTTDVIVNCAFGTECDSLKNPDSEFSRYGKLFFKDEPQRQFVKGLTFIVPWGILRKFGVRWLNPKLSGFFTEVIQDIVSYREKNNIYRPDFMHLLLQLKNRGELSDDGKITGPKTGDLSLTFNELAAQAFVFYLGGYDTSSVVMTYALLELALNQDMQEKCRREVEDVLERYDDKMTYEGIMEMTYLEQVVYESMRKYPPFCILNRKCTKEYKVPGTDVVLEEGTSVHIPVYGIHHDEKYYPDPEKFDPERWSPENRKKRPQFTFLTLGEGPRVCIGNRFGIMQSKAGLAVLLKRYRFTVSSQMSFPLEMDPTTVLLAPKTGVLLDYERI